MGLFVGEQIPCVEGLREPYYQVIVGNQVTLLGAGGGGSLH